MIGPMQLMMTDRTWRTDMTKIYHTLLSRTPGELFAIEFGDFDKSVVLQEHVYLKESGSTPPKTTFKVISSKSDQPSIKAAVEFENEKIKAKVLTEALVASIKKHHGDERSQRARHQEAMARFPKAK